MQSIDSNSFISLSVERNQSPAAANQREGTECYRATFSKQFTLAAAVNTEQFAGKKRIQEINKNSQLLSRLKQQLSITLAEELEEKIKQQNESSKHR